MDNSWAFAFLTAPSLVGALLGHAVELYAEVAPDKVEVATATAPRAAALGRHAVHVDEPRAVTLTASAAAHTGDDPRAVRAVSAVRHQGRVFVAVSTETVEGAPVRAIQISSSIDGSSWRREIDLPRTADVQGPKLLSHNRKLYAYFSETSGDLTRSYALQLLPTGLWSEPTLLDLDGQVISQAKTVDGVPLMTTHVGGSGVYRLGSAPSEVRLLTTADGLNWHPPTAGARSVYRGGGSDTSFASGDDGNLMAVVRNEAGDDSGWGSSVCLAATGEWTQWDCVNDPRNYGASALFSHDGEVYMVGRRQLGDGDYDRGFSSGTLRAMTNQAVQMTTGKRCSVWRFDRTERAFTHVIDLPSKGDTCAPAVIPGAAHGEFVVYAQSSDLNGPDLTLQAALGRSNKLYRYDLRLTDQREVVQASATVGR